MKSPIPKKQNTFKIKAWPVLATNASIKLNKCFKQNLYTANTPQSRYPAY